MRKLIFLVLLIFTSNVFAIFSDFDNFFNKYVDENGFVNYKNIDREDIDLLLNKITKIDDFSTWSENVYFATQK